MARLPYGCAVCSTHDQGGDFTHSNGTGGESLYGKKFEDEHKKNPLEHLGHLLEWKTPNGTGLSKAGKDTSKPSGKAVNACKRKADGKWVTLREEARLSFN